MTRRQLLIACLCWFSLLAMAQTYTGSVCDTQGRPLPRASVSAKSTGNKVVAFSLTDKEGRFKLTVGEKKASTIAVSMMGYATKSVAIESFKNDSKIVLEEQVQQLKEVKVKQQRVRQEGDTLVYSVAGFKQKNDRTIADVLARMPGIMVNDNGSITYQGEPINSFYVEGMDLMGNGYAQISENLQADKVKNVEVYEKHQRVKAKRGIENVRSAALNLVLDEKTKGVWQGNIEVGTGTAVQDSATWLRKLKWTEMMFGKKLQTVSIYQHANVNERPNRRIESMFLPAVSQGSSVSFVNRPPVDNSRYLREDSHLATTNWITRLGKDATLRTNMYASYGHDKATSQVQTQYLDVLNATLIDEFSTGSGNRQNYGVTFNYTLNANKTYLKNELKTSLSKVDCNGNTLLNNQKTPQRSETKRAEIRDQINGFLRFRNNQTVDVSGSVGYSYRPSSLLLLNGSVQESNTHTFDANASSSYGHRLWKLAVRYQAGFNLSVNRLALYGNGYQGEREDNRSMKWHITPSTTLPVGKLRFSLSLPIQWYNRSFEGDNRNDFIVDYRAEMAYETQSNVNTYLRYSNRWMPGVMPSKLSTYTDYRNKTTGNGMFNDNREQMVDWSVKYRNLMWGLNANAQVGVSYMGKSPLYECSLQDGEYQSVLTQVRHGSSRFFFNASASKTLGFWRAMFFLSANGSHSSYKMIVDGNLQSCSSDNCMVSFNWNMQPLRFLSFKGQSSMSWRKQDNGNDKMPSLPDNVSGRHQLTTYLMLHPFMIEWSSYLTHNTDRRVPVSSFSDILVRYRKKHLEVTLSCQNIFGKKSYYQRTVTTNMERYEIYTLRPRELLATISFDL